STAGARSHQLRSSTEPRAVSAVAAMYRSLASVRGEASCLRATEHARKHELVRMSRNRFPGRTDLRASLTRSGVVHAAGSRVGKGPDGAQDEHEAGAHHATAAL